MVAASLRGGTRVMNTDEAILFSAFPGSIVETAGGLDLRWMIIIIFFFQK